MNKNLKDRLDNLFAQNPGLKELWVTSDGQIFKTKSLADAYSVKDKGMKRAKKLTVESYTPNSSKNTIKTKRK